MWVLYALLSAIFAALVSILAKLGLKGINSNLATAIRTFVVLLIAWGIVFVTGKFKEINTLTSRNWMFLLFRVVQLVPLGFFTIRPYQWEMYLRLLQLTSLV